MLILSTGDEREQSATVAEKNSAPQTTRTVWEAERFVYSGNR